jgi:flavorubredoxin
METTRPRDVQRLEIATDTLIFRSRSWGRFRFEIEYALQRGTSANSYLIEGSKIALFDPPGESFRDIFLTALAEHRDPSTIDYIILGHINPNRTKTLEPLLDLATNATIICSNPAAISLQQLLPNLSK